MRALIDKRKTVQAHLAGTLSRDSACFIALYESLRYFERDLSKLQVSARSWRFPCRRAEYLCPQNYIEMNATGFRKILKKWDKRSKSTTKELYLARQVDVQPCFNRDVISELADTAAANVRKLEGLCIAKGGEQTLDPAADGILSERRTELAAADAEAQDDLLSNLENELNQAIKSRDRSFVESLLQSIPSNESLGSERRSQLARIFWRAAIVESTPTEESPPLIDTQRLDFSYIDDINGRTPLIDAAAKGKLRLVALCLANGVSIGHRDVYGREAIHYAASASSEVTQLLLEHGANTSSVDLDGASPLIHAISTGCLPCARILIERGALAGGSMGEPVQPLALAAKHGFTDIVSLLLASGSAVAPDASGYLPHHIAAKEGHLEVLAILLQAGADVNAIDKFANWTPLFHAAHEGHLRCALALLEAGASVSTLDDQGKTAIHYAAWAGHPEIVSALLSCQTQHVRAESLLKTALTNGQALTKKRPAADLSVEIDMDVDLIPDLSLPPPALPLRTYGHSYLDSKRSLLQIALGHPTTTASNIPAVRFYEQEQPPSFKVVITSKNDTFAVPHTVMLPQADEKEAISLLVDSLNSLILEIEIYPTFGSRLIGKAVCLPLVFSHLKSTYRITVPILANHLGTIGEVSFEATYISHFEHVQLAIGGRLETYWKSTTTEPLTKAIAARSDANQDPAYITATSLTSDYAKLVVQVRRCSAHDTVR